MSEMIKEFNKGDLLYIGGDEKAQWGFPEGYPHKEIVTILDGTFEFVDYYNNYYVHQITDENFIYINGESYTVIWDCEAYQCVATTIEGSIILGNLGIMNIGADTGEPFLFIIHKTMNKSIMTNDTAATHTITVHGETSTPFFPDFLPIATTTTSGIVKQMSYLPNATGAAPTAEEFNALLKSLRDAGILATE